MEDVHLCAVEGLMVLSASKKVSECSRDGVWGFGRKLMWSFSGHVHGRAPTQPPLYVDYTRLVNVVKRLIMKGNTFIAKS